MKKIIALLLVLALALSLAVPAAAAEPEFPLAQVLKMQQAEKTQVSGNSLVFPFAQSLTATAIKGGSALLQFKLNRYIDSTDVFAVAIVRGSAENLDYASESDLVEERYYKISDFYNRVLNMTWTADARYPIGEYTLITALLDKNGEPYYQYTYAVSLFVVDRHIPATDLEVVEFAYGDFEEYNLEISLNEVCYLAFVQTPIVNTSDRKTTFTVEHPQILAAGMDAGYIVLTGTGTGFTDLTVTCGNVTKTFQIAVERSGMRFTAQGVNTELCVGMQDTIAITSSPTYNVPFVLDYESKNPDVVTVEDGVVTAVGPGTATVVVSCADRKTTITYKVTAHELPEDTPVSERTATKPSMAVGPCSLCGQDDAVNIIEKAIFTDTNYKSWYSDHVDYVYDKGIMNGSSATTFAPDRTMTRAELVTVLYRIAGSPKVTFDGAFVDVSDGTWYSKAVTWAAQNKVVNGVGDNRFAPTDNITREQIATILYRYTKTLGVEMAEGTELNTFPDSGNVGNYAKEAMAWAVAEKLINGTVSGGVTSLSPKATATRAQLATMISRYQQMFPETEE